MSRTVKSRYDWLETARRGRSVILRTPDVFFTPVKDTKGRASGIEITIPRRDPLGLVSAFIDISDRTSPTIDLYFAGFTPDDARGRLGKMLDDLRSGRFGTQRDIRDAIESFGDPAGKGWGDVGGALKGAAKGAAKVIEKYPTTATLLVTIGLAVAGWILSRGSSDKKDKDPSDTKQPSDGTRGQGDKEQGGEQGNDQGKDKDKGNDQKKNKIPPEYFKQSPPPIVIEALPREDQVGGVNRPTREQLVQVHIELKHYVPPARDDRDGKDGRIGKPEKPIDRTYNPAVDWGPDKDDKKYKGITTRIIKDPGFVDPLP